MEYAKFKKNFVKQKDGYLFILPQMILFFVFMIYPIFEGFRMSLYKVDYISEKFIGFENYKSLFSDPNFIKSIYNTLIFIGFIVALTVIFGIFVAAALFDKNTKYISFIRGCYYIPVMVSMVVMSMIWNFLLNPANGLINYIITALGGNRINFLGNKNAVMPVVIFVTFTTNVGQAIILYIAAMMGVSNEFLEAAEIDGATRWQKIIHILVPLVRPTTLYVLIMNIIAVLKIFIVIQLLTSGGPNYASVTMMYYLYLKAFSFNQIGEASAIGVIMFLIALVLSVIQFKVLKREEQEGI
ncbi:carbohydrate ABC transporter permease [Xylanivirga thermophila]|uniref:carbohydrate ABC transporter permease n=1 Tax=Xylanivirga thermophila TaxID=2496273 RepID=UPI00101C30A9|nr:sugar ABC transporter permease [Xylanivirga thermophila]